MGVLQGKLRQFGFYNPGRNGSLPIIIVRCILLMLCLGSVLMLNLAYVYLLILFIIGATDGFGAAGIAVFYLFIMIFIIGVIFLPIMLTAWFLYRRLAPKDPPLQPQTTLPPSNPQ